jgi:predicted hydrolase (HD superfamily)
MIMNTHISRSQAWELFTTYNKDFFHLQHALTVEGVMQWYAKELGFSDDAEYWGITGLLHDIDFEQFPEAHCIKAPELLRSAGVGEDIIHAVVSHGYGLMVDVEPLHLMEKVLYATDELTGLIWAVAIIRPSKSVQDMEVKSVKKKYKMANFAAGCSRDVIEKGAVMLGWELDTLIEKTILAMRSCEADVNAYICINNDKEPL